MTITSNASMMPLVRLGSPLIRNVLQSFGCFGYEVPGVLVDEYVHMSESTCLLSMYNFLQGCGGSVWP